MELAPREESEVTVQETTFRAVDKKDPPSALRRMVSALRECIGLKPLYLAERFAEAKVKREEAEAEAVLLEARGKYEEAMARARQAALNAAGKFATDLALARFLDSLDGEQAANAREILNAQSVPVEVAVQRLEELAERIRLQGGSVEIRTKPTD